MRRLAHNKCFVYFLLAAVAAVMSLSGVAVPASANPGISLSPFASVTVDVTPGETITHRMKLSIGEQDKAMDMAVDVMGYGSSSGGTPKAIAMAQDTSPYSARSFVSVDKSSIHLEPGGSQEIIATITVPPDIGEGGRYAIIYIHEQQPAGASGAGSFSAFNIPILLTVKDSTLSHTGMITEITAGKAVSGQPVEILVSYQNTGNHHFKVTGEVTISNDGGEVLDTIHLPLSSSSVIPTTLRQVKATFIPQGELALGVYSLKSRLILEDGTLLDEASGSFEVEKPYVPPPPPASITLTPSSASELKTTDGRISISFPQGAVISQVEISVQNYPLEQLPAPPSAFEPATTCFRVDGLTGLLAKEATVTVKYTTADLDKAGGDASRLRLARWDEANNQWSVLKTELDKAAMTLTTRTNHLSIWAVMVATTSVAPPAGVNWPVIGGVVAGVIIVALLVYFLAVRRRRRGY